MVRSPEEFCTPSGDTIHRICSGRFNGRTLSVVETGSEDIQQKIQAHAPFTDLRYMLSRLSLGDSDVLSSSNPLYGDFSGLSDNPVDAINAIADARGQFDRLSLDEKMSCNNDWRIWFASLLQKPSTSDVSSAVPDYLVSSSPSVVKDVSSSPSVVKDVSSSPSVVKELSNES